MVAIERRSGPIPVAPKPKPDSDLNMIHSLEVLISEKKLGSGGYGDVFEANWKGTLVAVKVLAEGVSESVCRKLLCQ